MSVSIKVVPVEVGLELTVPHAVIEAQMGYHPGALGEFLARQVLRMEAKQGLGYFPAFDNYRPFGQAIEPELIVLIDQVADYARRYAEQELQRGLGRVFASVALRHSQLTCYAMPRVLPSQKDAQRRLGEHFAPDTLRMELLLETTTQALGTEPDKLIKDKIILAITHAFSRVQLLKTILPD